MCTTEAEGSATKLSNRLAEMLAMFYNYQIYWCPAVDMT